MDLQSGVVVTCVKFDKLKVTPIIKSRVEEMVRELGLTSLKFYNRKWEILIHQHSDLLKGVHGDKNREFKSC